MVIKHLFIIVLFVPLIVKAQTPLESQGKWYVNEIDTINCSFINVVLKDSIELSEALIKEIIFQARKKCIKENTIINLGFANYSQEKILYRGSPPSHFLIIGRYEERKKNFYFLYRFKGMPKKINIK
jgi:hypothetical protein